MTQSRTCKRRRTSKLIAVLCLCVSTEGRNHITGKSEKFEIHEASFYADLRPLCADNVLTTSATNMSVKEVNYRRVDCRAAKDKNRQTGTEPILPAVSAQLQLNPPLVFKTCTLFLELKF